MTKDNKKLIPTYLERGVMKSFARALEEVVRYYHLSLEDFVKKAVTTEIFEDYLEDYTMYSQAGTYIAGKILDELKIKNLAVKKQDDFEKKYEPMYAEIAYWLGYVLIFWKYREDISGEELFKYDINEMILSYEILHTQDCNYAIDIIKEEYRKP